MGKRRRKNQEAPGWAWMLFGLSLGLVVAGVVYVRGGRPTAPITNTRTEAPPPRVTAVAAPQDAAPQPTPESRFDFYEMLPQFEVVIPEAEPDARREVLARALQQPGRYILQAGAFSSLSDADSRQANLAMLGIESRIQRVTIDADVFHRVRVGPMDDLGAANEVRRRLRDARIETILMKVPE